MKAFKLVLLCVIFISLGCSGKKTKESPETGKAPEIKGEHMRGEPKELGKEDSISEIVQKQEAKQQEISVAEAPAEEASKPKVVEVARDEFNCSNGDANAKEKARKLNNEGLGYYRKGLYKAAITAFKYAYSLDCSYLLAATNTASTYAKTGEHVYAMGWLNVAYKLNPTQTINKLQKDKDYLEFISEFLMQEDQKESELAKAYLAVAHQIPPKKTKVPSQVSDVEAPKAKKDLSKTGPQKKTQSDTDSDDSHSSH